jgi:hypothetical protein
VRRYGAILVVYSIKPVAYGAVASDFSRGSEVTTSIVYVARSFVTRYKTNHVVLSVKYGEYSTTIAGYSKQESGYNHTPVGYDRAKAGYNHNPVAYSITIASYDERKAGHSKGKSGYAQRKPSCDP